MAKESKFEQDFCKWARRKGMYVIKASGPGSPKGTPDRIFLMPGGGWAAVEFKESEGAPYQVLQEEQLERLDGMWYSATAYPENEHQIKAEIEAML